MIQQGKRNTEFKSSVSNTLDEVIRMAEAETITYEWVPEYWIPSFSVRAVLFHYGLEIGLKGLRYGKHVRGHGLKAAYRGLTNQHKDLLNDAFADAVSFYRFETRKDAWAHLSSFQEYLRATAQDKIFENLRYWPIEGEAGLEQIRLPDLWIHHEMVRFLSMMVKFPDRDDCGRFFTSRFVARVVDNALFDQVNADTDRKGNDWNLLREWIGEFPSVLLAVQDAYEHDFSLLNDWGNAFMREFYNSLREGVRDDYKVRPALNYVLSTFGAESSDFKDVASAVIGGGGSLETVGTPGNKHLGVMSKRHDGLYRAGEELGELDILAKSRNDAIGLLVERGTEIVSVSVNGGAFADARVYFRVGSCEFWDINHRIENGDKVVFVVNGQGERHYRARGVDGRQVMFEIVL